MNYLRIVILFLIFIYGNIYSQNPPSDFKLVCTSGGLIPWSSYETITILANGQIEFVRIKGTQLEGLVDTTFTISSQSMLNIWQAVQNNNFFLLNVEYTDDSTSDGSKVLFTITANGKTSQVAVKNISQQEIENIIASINSNIPAEFNIDYRPPEKFDVIPDDPCGESSASNSERLKEYLKEEQPDKFKLDNVYSGNSANELQISHGGFEIGYEMSMHDAIASGRASTKGKGGYFGDGVSITGNNTDFPPPGNRIKFKLYLEFFGPCDKPANESKIVNDIYRKWKAQTTCDGKMIDMEIVTLSHFGEETAPGTPGFDNIKLECGTGRSNVPHLGIPNTNNTANGTWYPEDPDNQEGLFAHEAGHLMGLEDQYVDWIKLKSGNWYNSKNRGDSISIDEMRNLIESRAPDLSPERIEFDLDHRSSLSIPNEKHENDMMARVEKPILQSDICSLAALAGLIIKINTGDILASTAFFNQNLVVTHSSDFFLRPGEIKTLNGIYTALCCFCFFSFFPLSFSFSRPFSGIASR